MPLAPTPTTLVPSPSPTLWMLPPASDPSFSPTLFPMSTPTPSPTKEHANIWRVDYNAMMERDAARGWEGLGYVLLINTVMFAIAFGIFMRFARSTRYSLYHFRTSPTSPPPAPFTLRKWAKLLWQTPIQGTNVERKLGPEGTFYLVYQVYALRLLLVLSAYAMVVLIPLYLSVGTGLLPPMGVDRQHATNSTNVGAIPTLAKVNATATANTNATTIELLADTNATSKMQRGNTTTTGNEWWSFAHATIRSLPNDSLYLWVSVGTCYLFTAAFMVFFYRLSMLSSIPTANGSDDATQSHLSTPTPAPRALDATTKRPTSAKRANGKKPPRTPIKQTETPTPTPTPTPVTATAQDPAQLTEDANAGTVETVISVPPVDSTAATPSSSMTGSDVDKPEKAEKDKDKLRHLTGMQASALSLRSVFVDRGFPKNLRDERLLYLLHQVFPGYMDDVCVVYNLSRFYWFENTRVRKEATFDREKQLYEMIEVHGQPRPWSLRLFPGSMKFPNLHRIVVAWFCCRHEPFDEAAMQTQIHTLKQAEDASLEAIVKNVKGAGRAFLIFKSSRLRARFVRRVRNASVASILAKFPDAEIPRLKRYVRELGITRWHLSAAPEPDDIDWLSVSFPIVQRTAAVVIVNVLILLLLLTFTSPVAVTSAISSSSSYSTTAADSLSDLVATISDWVESFSPQMAKMMTSYIPTLILVMINAVLLNVLQIAGRIQPIATDSAKERNILRTSSIYLIFNTLFVPSLAFVSIDAVLLYLQTDGQVLDMLGTLFLHNSGLFYVNYVLQRCFLGTAVNLLRVSEFAKFCWEKPRAITQQEHVAAIEAWPFFTGTMSALQISLLTVVLTFSTVVPLILPIGALYFAMQHAVDKYALVYVRPRIKGRGSIARTATHATLFSLLLYQGAMSGFFLVRGTKMQSASVLVLLMATYVVSLWWYIRDKERAYGQTRKGHHVHGPHCKKRSRGSRHDSLPTEATSGSPLRLQDLEAQEQEEQAPLAVTLRPAASGHADEHTALLKMTTIDLDAQDEALLNKVRRRPTPSPPLSTSGSGGEQSDLYRAPALRKSGKNREALRAAMERARRSSYGALGGGGTGGNGHGSVLSQSMAELQSRDSLGFGFGGPASSRGGSSAPQTPHIV